MLGKPQAFGMFDGQIAQYPGWQENFYRVVHVQAVPLIHKVNALDQAVSVEVKNKYFKDLTSSSEDYLIRIRRLEDKFGGPGKHLSNMIQRIKAISEVGKDVGKVQDAVFALERFIESRYCQDPDDPLMSEIIRPNMRSEVRRRYRAFLEDRRLPDTPKSILSFLRRTLTIETDKDKEKEKNREKAKARIDRKKKKEKVDKDKKANYQFFNSPSSYRDTSEDSFYDETFDDSSDEERQFNWQKKDEICEFCEGLHNIFQCLKFFCELSHKQRRKWVVKEKRCPFCFKNGHNRSNCSRKRMCRFCQGEHNSCIHVEPKKSVPGETEGGKKNKRSQDNTGTKDRAETKKNKDKQVNKQMQGAVDSSGDSSSESDEATVHSSRRSGKVGKKTVSLTTFVANIRDPNTGNLIKVNALADSGADHTILSARAARDLGLWREGEGSNYYVKGHGGSKGCYIAQKFVIEVLDPKGKNLRTLKTSSYENPCGDLRAENWQILKSNWKHLVKLPLEAPVGDGIVDLVLGSSSLDLMEAIEAARFGPPGGPVAKLTKLGWIVGGKTSPLGKRDSVGSFNLAMRAKEHEILELKRQQTVTMDELREKYRLKDLKLKASMAALWGRKNYDESKLRNGRSPATETRADTKARQAFENSKRVDEEGYIEVGLLWKGKSRPKNNGRTALGIFLGMERRMRTNNGLWQAFDDNVQDWLQKGYARVVDISHRHDGFFIPTFMVVREDKNTTKFRLIVNGKFQFDDKCINDYLYSGPNVMNKLADVLLRFRYHKYVLTCDISNMFLRIRVPEKDRKFLRFYYRDPKGELQIVEMCSHAFGLTQSPFVVINAVRERAVELENKLTFATKAVLHDSIVDDILTGCKTYSSLVKLQAEIVQLYDTLQMQAHKWATNSPGLRKKIPEQQLASAVGLGEDTSELFCNDGGQVPSIKCLGVLWHPETDKLQFFSDETEKRDKWTMREISSRASKLFDPFGIMTPLILEGKLLLQSLWKLGLDWDDYVPAEICKSFNRWIKKASSAHLNHVDRRVKASFKVEDEILVIFTDASSQAQAAAAYLYCQGQEQSQGRLWAAKQKVSSLNRADSISRLELEGAVLGIELGKQLCSSMKWDMNKTLYFTDSTTVLWWLRTHRELDVFVGNRVCKILENSSLNQWFHINTLQNPADIPTRGMSGKKLASCDLWWEGPAFFKDKRKNWPAQPEVVETRNCKEGYRKEESRRIEKWFCKATKLKSNKWPNEFWLNIINRFENLDKAFAAAYVVFKWLGKFKRYNFSTTKELGSRYVQNAVFLSVQSGMSELHRALDNGSDVPKEYKELRPFKDKNGLIRVGGRLKSATRLPFSVRCPILIDGNHDYAKKLLLHMHCNTLKHCGGKRTLMSEMRNRVWITKLATLAKNTVRNCVWCNRSIKQRPVKMSKAPLHFTRLPLAKGCAFSEIGVDMAGPFSVKHGRSRAVAKRYVLLLTCCWTRALSLEVMDSASTESCLMAFLRHCNTYGFPRYVNSDRGSNFIGLDRHMKEQWEVVENALKQKSVEWYAVKWHFNPPYSPRFTGHVETMVKVTKTCLKKLLGQPQYLFRDEELCTLVKIAQGFANMRPLTDPSDDPSDPPPLTPADFLMTGNRFLGGIPELDIDKYEARNRKEMLGKITKELWEALTKEYISEIQKFGRVRGERELKKGDVVMLLDKALPTGRYGLGRIESVVTNPDGKARSFSVRYKGELLPRSIMTLAPLEGF